MRSIILAVAVAACASHAPREAVTAAPVIAAERAFAARAGEVGWVTAFREYVAPDGQLAQPGRYANAPRQLAESEDDGNRSLFWWPAFAGIARSGDLGFTTGPVSFDEERTPRGHYFTVWRRQPDGSWKWIYDGGVGPISNPNLIAPDAADVPSLPAAAEGVGVAVGGLGPADQALMEISAWESLLHTAVDLRERLAEEVRIVRSQQAFASGPDALAAALPADHVDYDVAHTEASAAGDLVMVLGQARWNIRGAEARGLYARIWQFQEDGWRMVYDQLILPPPG